MLCESVSLPVDRESTLGALWAKLVIKFLKIISQSTVRFNVYSRASQLGSRGSLEARGVLDDEYNHTQKPYMQNPSNIGDI